MLDQGYLAVNRAGEDYTLSFKPRINGGGPFLGVAAMLLTKGVGIVLVTCVPGAQVLGVALVLAAPAVGAAVAVAPTP